MRVLLQAIGMNVTTHKLEKDALNEAMTSGKYHMVFSETWGPPYDPHTYATSWEAKDEAHYSAMSTLKTPITRDALFKMIKDVQSEGNETKRTQQWNTILENVHKAAINVPFSGKRNPTVLNARLSGYQAGQQQFDYPMHTLKADTGSKTITVAPGAQTGLFKSVGPVDAHGYRPNEFFANNWVYEGLTKYGANGVVQPALAASWTIQDLSNGDQTYTFKLRQGVKFHDGEDWNCAAAKLNFDHVLAAPLTAGCDYHEWYTLPKLAKNFRCVDQFTFAFDTKGKHYATLQELSFIRPLRMLSPADFPAGKNSDPKTHNSCPAKWGAVTCGGSTITCKGPKGTSGTGPWKFTSKKSDSKGDTEVLFTANAKYWGGAPLLEAIKVVRYDTHADVKKALLDGSLDVVVGAGVLAAKDVADFKFKASKGGFGSSEAKLEVHLGPVLQNKIIVLNAAKAPTDDLQVRQAIIHAINKQAIIDKELAGLAEAVGTTFPTNAPYCNIKSRWNYDLKKAKALTKCASSSAYPVKYSVCGVTNTIQKAPSRIITMNQGD